MREVHCGCVAREGSERGLRGREGLALLQHNNAGCRDVWGGADGTGRSETGRRGGETGFLAKNSSGEGPRLLQHLEDSLATGLVLQRTATWREMREGRR